MSRSHLPAINPLMGMNATPFNVISSGQSQYWVPDVEELWALGVRKVRIGGTDPSFTGATAAGQALAILYKAKGFYVEIGLTFVNKTGTTAGKFNTAAQPAYLAACIAFATFCQTNGIDACMIENEMSSLLDLAFITQADFKLWMRDTVAPACRAVAPSVKFVINETASQIATWGALGITPGVNIDACGFNIYGGSYNDTAGFQTQVNSILSAFPTLGQAYVSEWNIYFNWAQIPFDQDVQQTNVLIRKDILNKSGLIHFFYTFKNTNTNGASVWNDFSTEYSLGTPNNTSLEWRKRKLYLSLFSTRDWIPGSTQKSLAFGGTATATWPATVSGGGISLMCWYDRQEYASGERTIFTCADATVNYKNGFRVYHDANRDIVLNTNNESGSNGFNVVTALTGGVKTHLAITIVPQIGGLTAFLYINGRKTGFPLSGFLGTPTQQLQIGGRIPDFFGLPKMYLRNLVIQNTNTPFSRLQIVAHMASSKDGTVDASIIPSGASYYDFNIDTTDQSGNGRNLVTTNTTLVTESRPGARAASGPRQFVQRIAV